MKKTFINWLGLFGIISMLTYVIAILFIPFEWPNLDWLSLGIANPAYLDIPTKIVISLYGICSLITVTATCVCIRRKLNQQMRIGIYLFAAMNWLIIAGYQIFPSNSAGTMQDYMHMSITVAVSVLSILSFLCIIIGGFRDKRYLSLALWALLAFVIILGSTVIINLISDYFSFIEHLSVFAVTGFTTVLGFYLFEDFAK